MPSRIPSTIIHAHSPTNVFKRQLLKTYRGGGPEENYSNPVRERTNVGSKGAPWNLSANAWIRRIIHPKEERPALNTHPHHPASLHTSQDWTIGEQHTYPDFFKSSFTSSPASIEEETKPTCDQGNRSSMMLTDITSTRDSRIHSVFICCLGFCRDPRFHSLSLMIRAISVA